MKYTWIQDWLREADIKQSRLADAMGIGPDTLSKIFAGTREMKLEESLACAKFFNKAVEEVITGNEEGGVNSAPKIPFILDSLRDYDTAIVDALKTILMAVSRNDATIRNDIKSNLIHQRDAYDEMGKRDSYYVMAHLLSLLDSSPPLSKILAKNKPSGHAPAGKV